MELRFLVLVLIMAICTATKDDGSTCKANARGVTPFCRWHDPSDEARAAHRASSQAGGFTKAYGALAATDSLATDPAVAALDLSTPSGVRDLVAAMLRALTKLPVDIRLANAFSSLATTQRGIMEASDMDSRFAALEAAIKATHGIPNTPDHTP